MGEQQMSESMIAQVGDRCVKGTRGCLRTQPRPIPRHWTRSTATVTVRSRNLWNEADICITLEQLLRIIEARKYYFLIVCSLLSYSMTNSGSPRTSMLGLTPSP